MMISFICMMKSLALMSLCILLSACAAMEAENSSNTPIPPARDNPFGGTFGSTATTAEGVTSMGSTR